MKKAEAIGTMTRATVLLDELTKYELQAGELDIQTRNHQLTRLRELHAFLQKITDKEYGEISDRKAEVKFKAPQLFK